jgi:integrase
VPRARNPIPSYRLHRPSGRAYSDFTDPLTGRRRSVCLGGWNSPDSRTAHAALCAEVAAGRPADPVGLSVAELLLRYLRHADTYYRKDGAPTDEVDCLRAALRVVRELYAAAPAAAFDGLALRAVQGQMVLRGWSRTTVNKHVGRVRRVFRWGLSHGLVPAAVVTTLEAVDPLKAGRTSARETAPVRPVADADVERTLPRLSSVVRAMVQLQRLCGGRPQDVIHLRPADVDRSRPGVWLYSPPVYKTQHLGKPRVLPLGPRAQAVLAPFLARDPLSHCFNPREAVAEGRERRRTAAKRAGPAACGPKTVKAPKRTPGVRYTTDSYRHAVQEGAERAGVPAWSPNQLRHAAATAVRARFGVEAARTTLGHADVSTTLIYAERDLELAVQVALELG